MDFLELAQSRYSVRKFKKEKIEQSKLDQILCAAQVAPTAVNFQPQKILILNNEKSLEQLSLCTRYSYHAPCAFVICYDKNLCYKREYDSHESGEIDASIVGTHMILEAANIGIGSTWVMSFDTDKLKKIYKIPSNYEVVSILVMGYEDEKHRINPLHYKTKTIEEMTFYNSF